MPVLESTQEIPLKIAEDGTVRIGDTRVSLDSVVHHYQQGATAEEIALRFPAVRLADVHYCLAYFLNHPQEVQEYLQRQQQRADGLRERITADPAQQRGLAQIRERIQNRVASRRQGTS
jgi:uncharacterized protein (DUF433 family)